jgi:hypothetical protein
MHSRTSNGLVAANDQPAETYTPNASRANYPTGGRLCKQKAPLTALLLLVRHFVHRGRCGDYNIYQYGRSHYCHDLIQLYAHVVRLEVRYA